MTYTPKCWPSGERVEAKRTACSGWFEATVVRGTDGHGRTKVRIDGYKQDCWAFDIRPLADITPAVPEPPVPKVRKVRPGWMLKPGSRAAWGRGCKCYTIPGLLADGRDEHQAHCPLRKKDETHE